jgi:hypothetical protein
MTTIAADIERELLALSRMTTQALCERYAELHGQPVRTRHRQYLIRKIAWRIQALAEGDLSERARQRAAELAHDADVRVMPPRARHPQVLVAEVPGRRAEAPGKRADDRLPAPGTALVRQYKGRQVRVLVLPNGGGLEYEGERYRTITAVAEAVTGTHINGYRFFGLSKPKGIS